MGSRDLPDAELEVLAVLWQLGDSTTRQVREALEKLRPMSHGAVFTLLRRLEQKGHVARTRRKVGKAFVYRARLRPTGTYRKKVRELVDRVFRGSSLSLVSALFESRPPSDDELVELEKLIDGLRRKRGQREISPDATRMKGGES